MTALLFCSAAAAADNPTPALLASPLLANAAFKEIPARPIFLHALALSLAEQTNKQFPFESLNSLAATLSFAQPTSLIPRPTRSL